jgi:hypothetical protein
MDHLETEYVLVFGSQKMFFDTSRSTLSEAKSRKYASLKMASSHTPLGAAAALAASLTLYLKMISQSCSHANTIIPNQGKNSWPVW